jgi:16S rRNA (adenine1518-N6/adenine1519-N6)-dimethyltransferase
MLQKEVVDRITAQPGEHAYGRLSVMVQYACSVEYLLTVDATSFHPPPKVTSAVVRLSPFTEPPFIANDLPHLSTLVKQAFSQRRKMLHNTLKGLVSSEQIVAADIDPNIRAEEISVKEFVRLSNMTSSPK